MTSLEITATDAFLDMPQSSQLLYFHLNSLADDDGFVANPRSIMRNCGAQADDLKLLIAKKFVIAFEDGVCVIKHWRINNFVRKDIYKETKYLDLKSTLLIRPNGAYTLNDDGKAIPLPKGHFNLEDVNATLTQRQPRIGKVRIGKDREDKERKGQEPMSATADAFASFWEAYPKKELKKKSQEIWKNRKLDKHVQAVLSFIEKAKDTDRWKRGFIPQPTTFLNGERWNDDVEAYNDRGKKEEVIEMRTYGTKK